MVSMILTDSPSLRDSAADAPAAGPVFYGFYGLITTEGTQFQLNNIHNGLITMKVHQEHEDDNRGAEILHACIKPRFPP